MLFRSPQAILSDTDWTALHWDIWQAQDLNSIPPPQLPKAMDPSIQHPLTALPDPPSPVACDPKPPYKCTSHPSIPTDTLSTHPTTITVHPPPTMLNSQHHHQPHHPTAHQHHRLNQLNAANQRPTSYSTFSTAAQLHSPVPIPPTRQQPTIRHTGHQPPTTQLIHAIT